MTTLSNLTNCSRPLKGRKRVGRGVGSNMGKTCCRGHKGDKSRSGYKRRHGAEGGQVPLYRRVPTRGFSRARFQSESLSINLGLIDKHFADGEVVNHETLRSKGMAPRRISGGLKILSNGELTKKVTIEAQGFSKQAEEKLKAQKVEYKVVPRKG